MQKAYRELEAQPYIYSVKGKGSFVNHMLITDNSPEIIKVKEQIKKQMAEALFLGVTVQDLQSLIIEANESVSGGELNDPSSERNKEI